MSTGQMTAVIQDHYGSIDALRLGTLPIPVPAEDEVLIQVKAASVHADVWHCIMGKPYIMRLMGGGLLKPKCPVPGIDLSGVVVAVGSRVVKFKPGDEVFGECQHGIQWTNGGAYAEYATAPASAIALKPAHLSFVDAAALPTPALICLMNMRGGDLVKHGQQVLINGAGGAVGITALQIAVARGAEVTVVDGPEKKDLLASLGASRFINYLEEDFTSTQSDLDVIIDIPGNFKFNQIKPCLKDSGSYILIGHDAYGEIHRDWLGGIPQAFGLMFRSLREPRLRSMRFVEQDRERDMQLLQQMADKGQIKPVIANTYSLENTRQALKDLITQTQPGRLIIEI